MQRNVINLAVALVLGTAALTAGARPSGGSHWQLTIVSDAFRGKSAVARHRMVYEALGDLMKHDIHALKIEALPPDPS